MTTWTELETTLKALANYHHHTIEAIYPDGITWEVAVWLTSGADINKKTYLVKVQKTANDYEVLSYKKVV